MSDAPTPSETVDPAAWAQEALRRQAGVLEDLAQSGLRLAQAIESRAVEAEGAPPAEAAMGFARVARAVRMTCLLQSKLIKDMELAASRAAYEAQCAARRVRDPWDVARDDRSARVQAIVARVARDDEGADEDRIEQVTEEAAERLDDDDIYGDVLARPMGALVAAVCRDLGLEPDWDRLGLEAWAQAEAASGAEGSPFLHSARPPSRTAVRGGGGPSAEEPMVVGAGHGHPAFNGYSERHRHASG